MKILQIAYYYPPMGGAGVQRSLKFSKYLGACGITPVVLAALDPHYVRDDSLGAEVPGDVAVHRVPHTPLLAALAARRRTPPAATSMPDLHAQTTTAGKAKAGLRDTALAGWQALQWPDEMAGWARRAAPLARRLIAESRRSGDPIRLVFSSSPPTSAHGLAQGLAQEFSLPWVADLRDLWTDNPAYCAPRWRAALDRRRETALLNHASAIVTVTRSWASLLAQRVGAHKPIAFIPNGYDESDFSGPALQPRRPPVDGRFRLTHVGTFYGPRKPAALLEGFEQLHRTDPVAAARLCLRLVGNIGARFDNVLAAFELRHPGIIERVPYVPHAQAIAEMTGADALLMVVGGSATTAATAGWLPGKLFEYLRARRPILVLGPPTGEAAAIVRGCAAGVTVDESDPAAIAAALAALVNGGVEAGAGRPGASDSIERYERRALTAQLASFLRQVAGHD